MNRWRIQAKMYAPPVTYDSRCAVAPLSESDLVGNVMRHPIQIVLV